VDNGALCDFEIAGPEWEAQAEVKWKYYAGAIHYQRSGFARCPGGAEATGSKLAEGASEGASESVKAGC
jgi:hypothetical protein